MRTQRASELLNIEMDQKQPVYPKVEQMEKSRVALDKMKASVNATLFRRYPHNLGKEIPQLKIFSQKKLWCLGGWTQVNYSPNRRALWK